MTGPQVAGPPRVVCLGGGHGLAVTLAAVAPLTPYLTAVVTVADDGGSSGRLRAELPALLPPGDLRMAICALAGADEVSQGWAALLQHRFTSAGELGGHAVGNLLLAGLLDSLDDPLAALDRVAALVGARGRVLPLSMGPLDIEADVQVPGAGVVVVRGQVAVATARGRVLAVRLLPPDATAAPAVTAAVRAAERVLLGPGSLFTSQLPHLLLPGLRDALSGPDGPDVVYVLNLAPQAGETDGMPPAGHLRALRAHAPGLRVAVVLADEAALPPGGGEAREVAAEAAALGGRVVLAPLARDGDPVRHDPAKLSTALRPLLTRREPPGLRPAAGVATGPTAGGEATWRR